ncbi:hypothetical protein [Gemmiger sp.]
MRATQKSLIDYDQIDSFVQIQKFVGGQKYASQLFNAKQDITRCYGRQAPNYSLLATVYEDKTTAVQIVPHDYQL